MLRLVVAVSLALACATGCHSGKSTELRVVGVHDTVLVQVTNPARRPMTLTKLEYVFASTSSGATISRGELPLYRELEPGAVAVVEVPLDADASDTLTLRGTLTAELDQMVRSFKLNAQIQPH